MSSELINFINQLASSKIQKSIEHQTKPIGKRTHLTFEIDLLHVSVDSTYYAYHMMLLSWECIAEGMEGLNFFAHCAFWIGVDELIQKVSENRDKLKLLKGI